MSELNIPRESTLQDCANSLAIIAMAQSSSITDIEDIKTAKQLVRQGLGPRAFPVGRRFTFNHSAYTNITFDVLAHNKYLDPLGRIPYSMTILMRDVIYGRMFDQKEAFFYCENSLAAGTYNFTVVEQPWFAGDVGKTFQFTLAVNVPQGSQLVLGNAYNATIAGSTISVYANGSSTSASQTAVASEGSNGTSLGSLTNAGSGNVNSVQRSFLGSNNYRESAIRQWINSVAAANAWWSQQTVFDRIPTYSNVAGFFGGFDSDFQDAIGEVDLVTANNTITDGGGSYTVRDRAFLLSMKEVGFGNNNGIAEGDLMDYYENAQNVDRIKYDIANAATARLWWLRSPYATRANLARSVTTDGSLSSGDAGVGRGCVVGLTIY